MSPLTWAACGLSEPRASTWEQSADGGQHDIVLAERRQHLVDVAEKGSTRADYQNSAPGQLLTVGIEKVGGPMERDHGFPGARSAFDDEYPAPVFADDAVLIGLDGGDDVTHVPGPAPGQGCQQRGLTG